ncbi:MAG: XRE family transcriptional regulator [Sphingobacteriaceae bacterium]|nr:MAG: XRE family transcriptional regulator [Sphingobacteriaceae bacterium]
MKLSLKIRTLRHQAGLDQQQAAEKLRISIAEYAKIETGQVKQDDAAFENMIAMFHLDRAQFEAWPDDKSKDWMNRYLA